MNIMRWIAAVAVASTSVLGSAMAAGNLTSGATPVKIDFTADKKFSTTSVQMETGKAYVLEITKVSGDEWRFMAPDLFNNSYIFQVSIDGKEIKTRHIEFLEFDDPGTVAITLVPNRVGVFKFWVPGQEATMTGTITVK